MAPLLRVAGLSHWRDHRAVLQGIGFGLDEGEVLGLLGPNGAGKTTCLEILSGNLRPGAGRVEIGGADLVGDPFQAKRQIGYLPERPPLYPEMSVDEYLGYCGRLRGVPRRDLMEAVSTARSRCGLGQVAGRLIRRLSKGYQQRVGLAQAIVHRPRLLILDEPTEGLDPVQIQEMRRLVSDLRAGCGIILASHLLGEIQSLCTRVQILNAGRLVYTSPLGDELRPSESLFQIALARPVTAELLLGLAGVAGVRPLGRATLWEIRLGSDFPVDVLAEQLVAQGFGLRGLTAQRPSLEETFLNIFSRDSTP